MEKAWSYNNNYWEGGSTNRGVNKPISVNMGDRVEVVLIQTLKTGGGVVGAYLGWR